jgi:proteic killer suppression protein
MKVWGFANTGLMRLYQEGNAKGVPARSADRLRKVFAFLDAMEDEEELRLMPAWRAQKLGEDRGGTWFLCVAGQVPLTFRVDSVEHEVQALNMGYEPR